ncbi:MAG: aldehyde ferredoxin oxidoreductase [Firmicutes bacterium]|nr:aldehyde ferredoxin oxidoreductase [Bacillota bacterium]
MYEAYNRKLLRVNLTDKSWQIEEIPTAVLENYVGGMGTGVWYLTQEVDPKVDPLEAENKLIFTTGPLSGTGAPLFAQAALVTKSPLTGGVINCYCGGNFAQKIKGTGFDLVIFEGACENLSYVLITPVGVKFVECPELQGKGVNAVEDHMRDQEGEECGTAAIGLAGESQVRFAAIIASTRVFGRGGSGAVMGSKNLKGVAFKGNLGVKVNDPETFGAKVDEAFAKFKQATENQFNLLGVFSRYGTGGGMSLINERYALATKNHKYAHFATGDKIDSSAYHKLARSRRIACFGCPVHCGQLHAFEGEKDGLFTRGPEYETMYSLGSDCFNDNPMVLARAHELCEEYGMDTLSAGCTIAFAMECFERGLLKPEEVGFDLEFGNGEAILKALELMARREGVGDMLADGTRLMAQRIGQGSADFAMNSKGMEFAAWMPQRMAGIALTFATSNRGACHKRGPIGMELMGEIPMESTEGKAKVVREIQDIVNALFTLVSCRFADFELPHTLFVELLNAATGMNKDLEEFRLIGERIWNLERMYNLASGLTGDQDMLPERCFEPIEVEGEEKALDRQAFINMLQEYYQVRGWDTDGVPTAETCERLGVELPWK